MELDSTYDSSLLTPAYPFTIDLYPTTLISYRPFAPNLTRPASPPHAPSSINASYFTRSSRTLLHNTPQILKDGTLRLPTDTPSLVLKYPSSSTSTTSTFHYKHLKPHFQPRDHLAIAPPSSNPQGQTTTLPRTRSSAASLLANQLLFIYTTVPFPHNTPIHL
jgi:hypothetical protein